MIDPTRPQLTEAYVARQVVAARRADLAGRSLVRLDAPRHRLHHGLRRDARGLQFSGILRIVRAKERVGRIRPCQIEQPSH